MDSNTEAVLHLKKKLDKGVSFEKTMHILYKLQKIPISIKLLEETGIGFKVRELSKAQKSNDIGKTAKLLTMNWKEYVRKNNEKRSSGGHSGSEGEGHSSEEQLQPQVNSRSNDDDEDRKGHRSSRESSSKHQHKHHHHSSGHSHRHNHRIEVNDSDQEDHHRQNETPRSEDGSVNGGSSGGSSGAERNSSRTSKKHKKKHKKNKSSKSSSSHNRSSHSHHNSNTNTNSGHIINLSDDSESEQERDRRKSKKRHREEEKQHKVVQPVVTSSSSSKSVNCDTTNQHHQVKRIRIKEPVAPPPPQQQEDLFGMMLGASDRAPMTVLKNGSGTKSSTTPSSKSINPMGRSSSSKVPTSNIYSSSSRKEAPSSGTSGLHHIDILNSLPDPNYRPNRTLPPPHQDLFSAYNAPDYGQSPTKRATDGDVRQPILPGTKLFKGRTAVYAGTAKLVTVPKVYPLQELCIKVLMNHVDQICEVGDLPYFLLKPVLLKCTVPQLKRIESYNPQLKEESDELWQEFCEKDFKGRHIEDSKYSTWRRFYNSLLSEREIKLRKITEGISSKARKAVPERKTQQIDLKTPREIRRKQERSTNPFFSPSGGGGGSAHRSSSSGYGGGGGGGGGGSLGGMVTLANTKPKTAPLMKKLLQMRKSKFGGGGGAARR